EADLWPALRGVSGCLLADGRGRLRGALLGLHARDPDAAQRIAQVALPRLLSAKPGNARPDGIVPLGDVGGRPVEVSARGSSVWVGWGAGVRADGLAGATDPWRSAGPAIRASWGSPAPQRAGAFWPGRTDRLVPPGSPLARALVDAPPVVWQGDFEGNSA